MQQKNMVITSGQLSLSTIGFFYHSSAVIYQLILAVDDSESVLPSDSHNAETATFDTTTPVSIHTSTQEVLVTLSDGSQSVLSIPAGTHIPSSSATVSTSAAAGITGSLDQWFSPVQVRMIH